MEDIVVILILTLAICGALFYIYKSKKRGETCIGCPYAKECAKKGGCKTENKQ